MIDKARLTQITKTLGPNARVYYQAALDTGLVDWFFEVQPLISSFLAQFPQTQIDLVNATMRPMMLSVLTQDFLVPEFGLQSDAMVTNTSWILADNIIAMSSMTGWQYFLVSSVNAPLVTLTNLGCPGTVPDDTILAGNFVTFRIPESA